MAKRRTGDIPASIATKAVLEGFGATLGSYSGELETKGDHDWIKVNLTASQGYDFALCFTDTGALYGDAHLTLRDANGAIVNDPNADMDDGGVGTNSYIAIAVPTTGTYYLDVSEHSGTKTGSYSLVSITDNSGILLSNVDDVYTGQAGVVRILAGAGADRIDIGQAVDAFGDQSNDIIHGNSTGNNIFGGLGADTIAGGAGGDFLFGDRQR
jgi:hypothetical protein